VVPLANEAKSIERLEMRRISISTAYTPSAMASPEFEIPNRLHVLLVDDNGINLKLLVSLMNKLACSYQTATNGAEAVELYKRSLQREQPTFDVIFMDISMPVMDGFEATRGIRKLERQGGVRACEVIALTGLGSEAAQQEALACGINLFLRKPVKLRDIKALLGQKAKAPP